MGGLGILLLFVGMFISFSASAKVQYTGHELWRVTPSSSEALTKIRQIGELFKLDIWQHPKAVNLSVDFRVEPKQAQNLKKALELDGFEITVLVPDIQSLIVGEKVSTKREVRASAGSLANFVYSEYHPAEEVYEWMNLVIKEHSPTVTKEQFGITYEGRPLYVLKFQKPAINPKPVIFVDALIHCREWITTASLLFIFKEMLRNPEYAHMLDDADWYFLPMINVDGYVKTWTEDRLWRKTRSQGASSLCEGVDGNRNWDAFWSLPGASKHPCSVVYHGPTAISESEVRHLANYVTNLGKGSIDAYITTHSYSQLILYPYHHTAEPSKDDEILKATGKLMHDAIKSVHGKTYVYGPGSTTIYPSSGTTTDWTYEVAGIVQSYTYELRDDGSKYGFLLPPDQIIPNGEEYIAGLQALSNYLKDKMSGTLL